MLDDYFGNFQALFFWMEGITMCYENTKTLINIRQAHYFII